MSPSKAVMQKFGYDTCIEIMNPNYFQLVVMDTLFNKGLLSSEYCVRKNCIYEGREIDNQHRYVRINSTSSPESMDIERTYWLKEPRFVHQQEQRLIWFPTVQDDTLKPTILQVPEITKVIRKINL